MNEAVAFMFVKNDKVLLEYRLSSSGLFDELFVPNGGVETKDRKGRGDYKVKAMMREIGEEFLGSVKPTSFEYLTKYYVKEMDTSFYFFVVDEWKGQLPKFAYEGKTKSAKLKWHNINMARGLVKYQSLLHALEQLNSRIINKVKADGNAKQ